MEMNCSGICATNNLTFDKYNLYLNPFHETEIQPKNARFKSYGKHLLTCNVHHHILRSPEHTCPTQAALLAWVARGGEDTCTRWAPRGWPPSNSPAVFWVTAILEWGISNGILYNAIFPSKDAPAS